MASADVFVLDVVPTPVHVEPVGRLPKGGQGTRVEEGDAVKPRHSKYVNIFFS